MPGRELGLAFKELAERLRMRKAQLIGNLVHGQRRRGELFLKKASFGEVVRREHILAVLGGNGLEFLQALRA